MEKNNFEEFDNVILLNDKGVFYKIITHPKEALKYIHENNYENYLTVIMFSLGIFSSLEKSISKWNNYSSENMIVYVFLAVIFGGLFGWVSFYFFGFLTSITGKWMKGKGNTSDFVRIYTYSSIPKFITLFIVILEVFIYNYLLIDFSGNKIVWNIYIGLTYALSIIQLLILVWIMILNVIGIAIVQKFSYGKAFLNYIAAIAIVVVPIILIILLFTLNK